MYCYQTGNDIFLEMSLVFYRTVPLLLAIAIDANLDVSLGFVFQGAKENLMTVSVSSLVLLTVTVV